jgi:hypothetical protein
MALVASPTGFGPVCDYIVFGSGVEGPIQSIEIISRPSINTSFLNINFDFGSGNDVGPSASSIEEPNINITDRISSLVSSGSIFNFGPICDRFIDTRPTVSSISEFLPEANLNIEQPADPPLLSEFRQSKPNLCRTVRLSSFTSSSDLGAVCDKNLQSFVGGLDSGDSVYFCPEGGEGDIDDEFGLIGTNPIPDTFSDEWPLPKDPEIRCYEILPGTTICYPVGYPEDFGLALVDPLASKRRDNSFKSSLYCGIQRDMNSWGVYEYVLPNTTDNIEVILWGAGGGAGGGDRGDLFSLTRSANNCGGSGSELKFDVALNPNTINIVTVVIGQGGSAGNGSRNDAIMTRHPFNRGGRGGHPGPRGVSGAGGAGGGATDFYINGRLVASASGGGGGSGQGCWGFNPSNPGKPYGNWVEPPPLEVSKYPKILSLPMQIVDSHPQWSNFMREYVVWPSFGQEVRLGEVFDARLNLEFPSSGTYTFQMAGDNALAVYISPFVPGPEGEFITDPYTQIFNGGVEGIPEWDGLEDTGELPPPPPPSVGPFNLVGYTTNFTDDPPTSFTYNIPSSGRYVLKFVFYNNPDDGNSWYDNPAGIAVRILRPNGSELWTTRTYYGEDGHNRPFGDGPGSGGGGGNGGSAGLTSVELGFSGGSCSNEDSTGQGGSGGASWILNHPSITFKDYRVAPSGFIAGWLVPSPIDESVRSAGGGWGGMRPIRFSMIYNGVEYPLQNSKGDFITISIAGMGQGVWSDDANGLSFIQSYFWGKVLGDVEPANNVPNITRTDPLDPRSLQLNIKWVPIKTGSSWRTEVRLDPSPSWALGTGWAAGDILPGKMPPAQADGTQPWLDKILGSWPNLNRELIKSGKYVSVGNGSNFEFQIKITQVSNKENSTDGRNGRAFFTATYIEEDEFYELTEN